LAECQDSSTNRRPRHTQVRAVVRETQSGALSWKVGLALLVPGGMHFFNLIVFARMRRHGGGGRTVAYAGTEGLRGFNETVGEGVEE